MELHEALMTRRTAHHYKPEPVPEEVITRALEAAHMAPNHKHTWPWRFIRVGVETRQALVPTAIALKAVKKTLNEAARKVIAGKLLNPAELIVVCQRRVEDDFQSREDYASCACAIQNIQLAAHADGYAAKWSTGGVTRHSDTYALLGVDASEEEIVGFVFVGVPERFPEVERPALNGVIRRLP